MSSTKQAMYIFQNGKKEGMLNYPYLYEFPLFEDFCYINTENDVKFKNI